MTESPIQRQSPLDLSPDDFREAGHALVDEIAEFLAQLPSGKVTPSKDPDQVRFAIGAEQGMPQEGRAAGELLVETARTLFDHSLFNGHPRFMGFITSSAAPIGALADLLASTVNPNVGGWVLSPAATEIELQTLRWIAELLGYPTDCGGLLVSGGNMANFVGFLCARKSRSRWDVRKEGMAAKESQRLRVYATAETHTWLEKAADLFGLGTDSIHRIEADSNQRMRLDALEEAIRDDRSRGDFPFLLVGSAGTVSTGAVDPLARMAEIAQEQGLWLHVDGAYGALAAALPESSSDLKALALADSVAFDPHKWLYAPLEAGCALVRDPKHLVDAFSYRPPYYAIDFEQTNFYEIGPQNSRGFRALKVWLGLKQAGRSGYESMVRDDIALARRLFDKAGSHSEIEAGTCNLSIVTFRYVPLDLTGGEDKAFLDRLNRAVMESVNASGDLFLSNAIVGERFWLRACIVNFRTSEADVDVVMDFVAAHGRQQVRLLREQREG